MRQPFYLGLDQGTTGVTALLLDASWRPAARGYREITQFYPRPGWVEHDPLEILDAARAAVQEAMSAAGAGPRDIRCIGLDHEGESVVVWEAESGRPVYPAIVWQDRRTAGFCKELETRWGSLIRERTGLSPDPYFSAAKLRWILDRADPDRALSRSGALLAGTMDAWMIWNFTGGKAHCTDASTASRTMLFNRSAGDWDPELLSLLKVDRRLLPEIRDSADLYGLTDPQRFLGLRAPVTGVLADQQAALFGQHCVTPGTAKITYGTGCFMLMNTGRLPRPAAGLVPTVAWRLKGRPTYALDGGVYIAGAALQWLRDGLGIIGSASETEDLALRAQDSGGVCFVPAFAGLAAPYWDSSARGMIIGITGGTTREQLVRAALESIAYQVWDVLDAVRRSGAMTVTAMGCDGGCSGNRFLMQFQSDLLDLPLDVPEIRETTALGAAYMAALGVGDAAGPEDFSRCRRIAAHYEPCMSADRRAGLLSRWHRAVERAGHWAED